MLHPMLLDAARITSAEGGRWQNQLQLDTTLQVVPYWGKRTCQLSPAIYHLSIGLAALSPVGNGPDPKEFSPP